LSSGEPEKEHFVKLMREYEAFREVQVLSHSVMSKHFHIPQAIITPSRLRLRTHSNLLWFSLA
jgi:hypothetical protein